MCISVPKNYSIPLLSNAGWTRVVDFVPRRLGYFSSDWRSEKWTKNSSLFLANRDSKKDENGYDDCRRKAI